MLKWSYFDQVQLSPSSVYLCFRHDSTELD